MPWETPAKTMEIALLVFLFLVGTVGAAMQAMKYLERRHRPRDKADRARDSGPDEDRG